MLAGPSANEPSVPHLNATSGVRAECNSRHGSRKRRPGRSTGSRRTRSNPLLNISIGKRLALGFVIPAIIAAITLSTVGVQSQQRLLQESSFYQHLFNAYTSLSKGEDTLQQLHFDMQQTVTYAAQPHPLPEILAEHQQVVKSATMQFNTTLTTYLQQDLLDRNSDLMVLFVEANHTEQINEQRTYSEGAQASWLAYRAIQNQMLGLINTGNFARAQTLLVVQEQSAFSDADRDLQSLIAFNETLVPSLQEAAVVEVQKLFISTLFAVLGVLLGIGLVGWLVSSTLVRRLQRLRSAVQAIANGQVDTRLDAGGSDEIAEVSEATNVMVDTLVGLLKALEEANAQQEALATTDMLTGLPNHRALQQLLEKESERARRHGYPFALLFFDGDRFKQVNDTYGHAVGDVVLRELGERARNVLRAGDTVGRFGGEEFLVILPETSEREAKHVAEHLRSAVAVQPLGASVVMGGIAVTVSIGVACYPTDGTTASVVRERADQAMYWAKRLGRNQVRTATEAEGANRDATLKARTAHALERRELAVVYERDARQMVRTEQLALIYSVMGSLEVREPGMSAHAHEVGDLVAGMARLLQFESGRVLRASTAAFLHDIGKIAIPDQLLQKARQEFTQGEWILLHQHAELGADIVEVSPWLSDLGPAIRYHHERWDGTGTPDGLAGEAIPLEARLIAVAEAYHAMISDWPYQVRRPATEALAEIERLAGIQFDPALVPVLRAVLETRREGESSSLWHARFDLLTQI